MPFKCALCELDIQVGESMVSDDKMNLAHESCVRRGKQIDPPTAIVVRSDAPPSKLTLTLPPPPPAPPSPPDPSVEAARSIAFRMSHNIPVPVSELSKVYGDACVPSRTPSVCSVCQKPSIAMCPYCHAYVHQNYGYDGGTACSLLHEGKCKDAAQSRNREKPVKFPRIEEPVIVIEPGTLTGKPLNGKHAAPKKKKGKGRR